jgi:hypothetical protein
MTTPTTDDLRRLLDSDQPDAVLVLVEGRLDVVAAEDLDSNRYRGAFPVLSREDLLAGVGGRTRSTSAAKSDSGDLNSP